MIGPRFGWTTSTATGGLAVCAGSDAPGLHPERRAIANPMAEIERILVVPPDREPSSARSGHECKGACKQIPRCLPGRTRCEPRTARGPAPGQLPLRWWYRRDALAEIRNPKGLVRTD